MKRFSGKLAVITGASGGIGGAIANSLSQNGAHVCLIGRKEEALQTVISHGGQDAKVSCYLADLSEDADLNNLIAEISHDHAHINLLVHSAGAYVRNRFECASIIELDYLYRLNVRAPYILTQAFLPMLKRGRGQVIFINSSVSLLPARANLSQYAATKHALKAIADSLREEINCDGIRVLTVYPGRTASSMQENVHKLEGKPYQPQYLIQPEDIAAAMLHAVSLPRNVEITDIVLRPTKSPG